MSILLRPTLREDSSSLAFLQTGQVTETDRPKYLARGRQLSWIHFVGKVLRKSLHFSTSVTALRDKCYCTARQVSLHCETSVTALINKCHCTSQQVSLHCETSVTALRDKCHCTSQQVSLHCETSVTALLNKCHCTARQVSLHCETSDCLFVGWLVA